MQKRVLAMALSLLFLLAGCGLTLPQTNLLQQSSAAPQGENTEATQQRIDTLRIAYNNTDELLPYLATSTMNLNTIPLLYDPLVKLDQQANPQYIIAQEVYLTATVCTVNLRRGLFFSDGTAVQAKDVLYSVQQARMPASRYATMLQNVTEVSAPDDYTVVFTLAVPDRFFANLLTFPIVKAENQAVGSGRYLRLGAGEAQRLGKNPKWYGENHSQIETIELISQLDKDALIYSLKLGTINYIYSDLSGNEAAAMGVNTQAVPLNNLLYIGMNSTKNALANPQLRQALATCLNREELVAATYANRAQATYTPFHPQATQTAQPGYKPQQDMVRAAALLGGLGYKEKDSSGYYITGEGRLHLRLLVNADNTGRVQVAQQVAHYLVQLGVEVTIEQKPFAEYKRLLELWDFDLYIGEVKLNSNMDLSFLLQGDKAAGFGVTTDEALLAAYGSFRAGTTQVEDFTAVFEGSLPFIPLMYRSGMVSFSRGMYFDAPATEQDIFYNIENW